MTVEYVDAGEAIDQGTLSGKVGTAPPVVSDVTYERILNARSEPENWLTYYQGVPQSREVARRAPRGGRRCDRDAVTVTVR